MRIRFGEKMTWTKILKIRTLENKLKDIEGQWSIVRENMTMNPTEWKNQDTIKNLLREIEQDIEEYFKMAEEGLDSPPPVEELSGEEGTLPER
tara:strand:- start:1132 stop:1410 length:279 start_codon:yes stop_codon:yes gene_type:complete